MTMTARRKAALAAAGAVMLGGVAWIYFSFDPSAHLFPRCMFLTLTGLRCPGCGSQRALHALLHGDVAAAWGYNALLILEIPLLIALAAAWLLRRRCPRLRRVLESRPLILTLLTVIILWTVARNITDI